MKTEFIANRAIYEKVILQLVPSAKKYLWIATADIKDMYVESHGEMIPFLQVPAQLLRRHVEIRLIHAKEPGKTSAGTSTAFPDCGAIWSAYFVREFISNVSLPTGQEPISAVPI